MALSRDVRGGLFWEGSTMETLIVVVLLMFFVGAMVRAVCWVTQLAFWLGARVVVGIAIAAAAVWWMRPGQVDHAPRSVSSSEPSAEAYAAAHRAVERATGRPCDYACKVMIADMARQRPAESAAPVETVSQ
jgi:hypothetical protein